MNRFKIGDRASAEVVKGSPSVRTLLKQQLETGYKYQQFGFNHGDLVPKQKCALKLQAWGDRFDVGGKMVLDIGCNLGFFTFLAAQRGALRAIGVDIDEKRITWARQFQAAVKKEYNPEWVKVVDFYTHIDAVAQRFDVILLWSVYHHLFKTWPNHDYWLKRFRDMLRPGGVVLYEGPFKSDYIIERIGLKDVWTRKNLVNAMLRWFDFENHGPALHTGGREIASLRLPQGS